MDISNWPIEKIMQLPDECFGSRWPVLFSNPVGVRAVEYFLSELSLPDRCVLWGLQYMTFPDNTDLYSAIGLYAFRLGTQVVTTDSEFNALENLLPDVGELFGGVRIFRDMLGFPSLRLPVNAQGRKVVLRIENRLLQTLNFSCALVFSGIPREIPDCYAGFPEEKFDEMIRLLRIGVKIR